MRSAGSASVALAVVSGGIESLSSSALTSTGICCSARSASGISSASGTRSAPVMSVPTPLTSTTASLLKVYFQERSTRPGQALFPNPHGFALSADAVQRRLSLHLVKATSICPNLADKHVTVHTLRHTAAMRCLEAGIDAALIAL